MDHRRSSSYDIRINNYLPFFHTCDTNSASDACIARKGDVKKTFCVSIDEKLIERMRNLVYWTPGISLNRLVEESLELCLTALEEKRGGAFPEREGKLERKL